LVARRNTLGGQHLQRCQDRRRAPNSDLPAPRARAQQPGQPPPAGGGSSKAAQQQPKSCRLAIKAAPGSGEGDHVGIGAPAWARGSGHIHPGHRPTTIPGPPPNAGAEDVAASNRPRARAQAIEAPQPQPAGVKRKKPAARRPAQQRPRTTTTAGQGQAAKAQPRQTRSRAARLAEAAPAPNSRSKNFRQTPRQHSRNQPGFPRRWQPSSALQNRRRRPQAKLHGAMRAAWAAVRQSTQLRLSSSERWVPSGQPRRGQALPMAGASLEAGIVLAACRAGALLGSRNSRMRAWAIQAVHPPPGRDSGTRSASSNAAKPINSLPP